MPVKKSQKPHLDFQSNIIGVAETLGDSLVNEIDSSDDELKELLVKELKELKRWQIYGGHSLKEIAEKWEQLRKKIADVRRLQLTCWRLCGGRGFTKACAGCNAH